MRGICTPTHIGVILTCRLPWVAVSSAMLSAEGPRMAQVLRDQPEMVRALLTQEVLNLTPFWLEFQRILV